MRSPKPAPPPGVLLEVQIIGPYPDLANQKLWEWGASILVLTTFSFNNLLYLSFSGHLWVILTHR